MKKYIIIFVCIINSIGLHVQSQSFTSIVSYPFDQKISSICETINSGYIAVGVRNFGLNAYKTTHYAIKLNSTGTIVDSIVNQDTTFCTSFIEVVPFNDDVLIFGSKRERIPPYNDSLIVVKTDKDLNILMRRSYYLQDSFMITQIQSKLSYDMNFYIFINTYNSEQNNSGTRIMGWLIKMDSALNIIIKKSYISNNSSKLDIQYFNYSKNLNMPIAFSDYYSFMSPASILFLNDSLEVDSAIDLHHDYHMRFYFIKNYLDSSLLLLSFQKMQLGGIQKAGFLKLAKDYTFLKEVPIQPIDTHQIVPVYQYFSRENNYFYCGLTYDANPYNLHYGGLGVVSWIRTIKYDDSLNIIFDKKYGGDAYYLLQSIIETSDKGCIISATKYNYLVNTNSNRDIFIMKLDSNGQITWTKNIKLPKSQITLFPNPATTTLNLRLQAPNQSIASLTVYNTLGQQVMALEPKKSEMEVDVRSLQSGVYLVEGFTNKGERFSGKFVKE